MGAAEFEGRKWYFQYDAQRQNKLASIMRAVRFWDIVLTTLHDAHAPWANRLNPLIKPFRLRDRIVQLSFSLLPPGAASPARLPPPGSRTARSGSLRFSCGRGLRVRRRPQPRRARCFPRRPRGRKCAQAGLKVDTQNKLLPAVPARAQVRERKFARAPIFPPYRFWRRCALQ